MTHTPVPRSPCIGICQIDEKQLCSGCHRTLSEIGRWSIATSEEKRSILASVQKRRFQAVSANLPKPKSS